MYFQLARIVDICEYRVSGYRFAAIRELVSRYIVLGYDDGLIFIEVFSYYDIVVILLVFHLFALDERNISAPSLVPYRRFLLLFAVDSIKVAFPKHYIPFGNSSQ